MRPNFFLVGVPKAGTTAVYHALRQHPDVWMSPHKEPKYFARPEKATPIQTLAQYEQLFTEAGGRRVVGEASTDYFHHPEAPGRIRAYAPTARAAVVLRDPADRAYSHFAMLVRSGAIAQRPYLEVLHERMWEGGLSPEAAYGTGVRQSVYADGLRRCIDAFGCDRFRVYLYRDLRVDPAALMADLFEFLGVDPDVHLQVTGRNVSSQPKSAALHRLLRRPNGLRTLATVLLPTSARRTLTAWVHRQNQAALEPLAPEARAILVSLFRPDIDRVEAILGRDLSHWRDAEPARYDHD